MARKKKTTARHSCLPAPHPPRRPAGEPAAPPAESAPEPRPEWVPGKSFPGNAAGRASETLPQQVLAPGLYVTATPIGNAADITLRALTVLRDCDAIVAEDTRVTSRLLSIYGISRPLLIYNDHNAALMRPALLQRLRDGQVLALVSDAGTPLVSDPGHKLVKEALLHGLPVHPVPGASALLAALIASGLPSDRFCFAGFLPVKASERLSALENLSAIRATLILFESAKRLAHSLAAMAEVMGTREAAVCRELTKLHEEVRRGPLEALARHYAAVPARGEVTVVVAPPSSSEAPARASLDALLSQALAFMPVRAAANLLAQATGASKREVYARALALKAAAGHDDARD